MEADWNKLIERYLQNELSEEGKEAFEYELSTNSELKMEVDLHLMIMGSVIRNAERMEITSIGKKYHFRKKLTNAAIISGVVLTAAITTYLVLIHQKAVESTQKITEIPTVAENHLPLTADSNVTTEPVTFVQNTIMPIQTSKPVLVENISNDLEKDLGMVAVTTKSGTKNKEEKKVAPEEEKYWITTIRKNSSPSTREDRPFYLSGNYTWAGDYMIMDTQEGLYMFDTTTNYLTIFKSGGKMENIHYSETVLFGIRHWRRPKEVSKNRIMYKGKDEWIAH